MCIRRWCRLVNHKLYLRNINYKKYLYITAKKFPSQDDIDRISKVTSDSPIIEEGRGSLGRKALESLKEIERYRQLHLCQQGENSEI